jgi:hypothetical protein
LKDARSALPMRPAAPIDAGGVRRQPDLGQLLTITEYTKSDTCDNSPYLSMV